MGPRVVIVRYNVLQFLPSIGNLFILPFKSRSSLNGMRDDSVIFNMASFFQEYQNVKGSTTTHLEQS
jgi:hypothetical protein